MTLYSAVLEDTVKEFPSFRVVRKSKSPFMRLLATLLFFNKSFMTDFVTTIGNYMWVPESWLSWRDDAKAALLRHERVHLRQQRRYGMVRYALMYLLWPVPFFYARGRVQLEQEAYYESLKAYLDYYGEGFVRSKSLKETFVAHFTTGEYGWMWVDSAAVEHWYDESVAKIAGTPSTDTLYLRTTPE